jgi:hypothetical protein
MGSAKKTLGVPWCLGALVAVDEWLHGCMDEWLHGCMVAWMNG